MLRQHSRRSGCSILGPISLDWEGQLNPEMLLYAPHGRLEGEEVAPEGGEEEESGSEAPLERSFPLLQLLF